MQPNLPRLRRALAQALGCDEAALLTSRPIAGASASRYLAAALLRAGGVTRRIAAEALGYVNADSYDVVVRTARRRIHNDAALAARYAAARAALLREAV